MQNDVLNYVNFQQVLKYYNKKIRTTRVCFTSISKTEECMVYEAKGKKRFLFVCKC